MEKKGDYNVELKSEEYNEVIGAIPSIFIRYGIGVMFVFLIFLILLSNNINYKTYAESYVSIEKPVRGQTSYVLRFNINPENVALIKKGQMANINLVQFPADRFGCLKIKIQPTNIKYVRNEGKSYYEWTQKQDTLITENGIRIQYIEGLQGGAKIIIGEETIAHKITQSIRTSLGINI